MLVQAFIAKLAVERFDVAVLHRLAGLNELQRDAVSVSPLVERACIEFWPLVGADRRWLAAETNHLVEHAHDIVASHAVIEGDLDRLLGEVIDRGQALQTPAVFEPVHDEVHRPHFVGPAMSAGTAEHSQVVHRRHYLEWISGIWRRSSGGRSDLSM